MGDHLKRLLPLALFLVAAVASAQAKYILTQTLGTLRNDFTGYAGFNFDTGANTPTVTGLCRWKVAGNTGIHALYLYKYVDGAGGDALIATAVVDTTSGTAGTYQCQPIATTALLASTTYYVISTETNGGDEFYNWTDSTADTFTAGVGTFGGGLDTGTLGAVDDRDLAGILGPTNFTVGAPPTPTRTLTPTRTNTPTITVTPTVTTPPCGWTQGHAMRRIGAGTYQATSQDGIIFADTTPLSPGADGTVTILLPPNPSDCTRLVVKKIAGPFPVILDGNGKLIDGMNTRAINTVFAAWKLAFQLNFQWGIL